MLDMPASSRPAVIGGARLRYERLPDVGTRLVEQWVRPPLHMAKAYVDQDWAISQLMSPTAGLLADDVLTVDVAVGAGAKAAVISPAACRVHTMAQGRATVRQRYRVEAGAVLDLWPAPLILQKGASLAQETRLDVASDASVLLCEVVTPGRAAYGESFEFVDWSSRLSIYREDQLLSYENFSCRPSKGDAKDWQQLYPNGIYSSLYFLSSEPLDELVQGLHDLKTLKATIGASLLRAGGLGVKILAADGISLRKVIHDVRNMLIENSNIPFPKALCRAQTFFH